MRALRGNFMAQSGFCALSYDGNDFSGGALHIQDNGVDAADEIIVARMSGDGYRQARGGADQRFPNPIRKMADMSVQTCYLHLPEGQHETKLRSQQTQQGR